MSAFNEWQMLCIAEDIEPGDTIFAEHIYEPEKKMPLVFCKESDDELWVETKDAHGKPFTFSADSLEQKGKRTKQWRIKNKAPIGIRLNQPALSLPAF